MVQFSPTPDAQASASPLLTQREDQLAAAGERFRHLRKQASLSQEEVARALGISRQALSQIERGQALPSFETLYAARRVFRTSYGYLLEGKEAPLPNASPATAAAPPPPQVIAVTVDRNNNPSIVLVPAKAQAGYARARLESTYLEELPTLSLPGYQFRNQTFRAFEVAGDSMAPTLANGDMLVCSQILNPHHLWPGELYVVVLSDDVLVKRLARLDEPSGRMELQSDNSFYGNVRLDTREVAELWRVQARLTFNFPAPDTELQQLRLQIQELSHQLLARR